jgi:hypothetical protein
VCRCPCLCGCACVQCGSAIICISLQEQRGKIYLQLNYEWFSTYTNNDLDIIEKGLNSGATTLEQRIEDEDKTKTDRSGDSASTTTITTSPESEVSTAKVRRMSAQWLMEDRKLVGVLLCCESPTSAQPESVEVRFRWRDVALPELLEKKQISRGGIVEKNPVPGEATVHSAVVRRAQCEPLSEPEPTPSRMDVWQGGSGMAVMRLKSAAKNALQVNENRVRRNLDTWLWELTAVNLSEAPLILMDCKVQFAVVGSNLEDAEEVVAVAALPGQSSAEFPVTLPASGTVALHVDFVTPAPSKRQQNWFHIAWVGWDLAGREFSFGWLGCVCVACVF